MSAVFTNIYADITPEFQELCTQTFPFTNVIQKVCDMTGVVFFHDRQPKLVGNWQTMKTVHDLLSGLVLYYKVLNEFDVGGRPSPEKARPPEREERPKRTRIHETRPPEREERPKRTRIHETMCMRTKDVETGSYNTFSPSSNYIPGSDITYNNDRDTSESYSAHEQLHDDDQEDRVTHYRDVQVITLTEVESDSDGRKNDGNSLCDVNENGLSPSCTSWHSSLEHTHKNDYVDSGRSGIYTDMEEDNCVSDIEVNKDSIQLQGENTETLACSECSYTTQCSRNLLHHRVRMHLRPWKCRSCGKGFGLQKDLQRHYRSLRSCRIYKRPQREPHGQPCPPKKPSYTVINDPTDETVTVEDDTSTVSSIKDSSKELVKSNMQSVNESSPDNPQNSTEGNLQEYVENDQISGVIKLEPLDYESSGETSKDSCTSHRRGTYHKMSDSVSESGYSTKLIKNELCNKEGSDQYGDLTDKDDGDKNDFQPSGLPCAVPVGSILRKITIQPHQHLSPEFRPPVVSVSVPHEDSAPVDHSQSSTNLSVCTGEDINSMQWTGEGSGAPQSLMASTTLVQPIIGCDSETQIFLCSSCDYKADTTKKVDDHIHRVHFKRFQCSKCPALFGLQKDLTRHYRKTHKMFIESQRRGRKANGHWQF